MFWVLDEELKGKIQYLNPVFDLIV